MQVDVRFFKAFAWCLVVCAAFAYGHRAVGEADAASEGATPMASVETTWCSPEFFPILPWGRLHGWKSPDVDAESALRGMAECHFTIAGFVTPEDLPLCEKLGLKAIMATQRGSGWSTLSDEEIDAKVKGMVEAAGESPAVLGYYITDEPGALEFPALGKAVAAVKKYAPGKLAYINLFPDYATIGAPDISQLDTESYTEYLERFVNETKPQLLSYDNYQVQYSNDLQNPARAASYYKNLLEMRRVALKYNLPFWNIVSSNQIRPFTTVPSPANLLFQAYTTLAAGGRGVSWYTYFPRNYGYAPVDQEERRTATWGYLEMVNRQVKTLGAVMNRLESTGVYFTSPPPVESLPVLPGKLVAEVACAEPVMIGEFAGQDGAAYVMAVNLSLERSAKVTLQAAGKALVGQVFSATDGSLLPMDEDGGLWLVAGQGALIRLP